MQEEEIEINSYVDFLELWPSLTYIAELFGIPLNRVSQWKRRDNLPPKYWRKLLADLPNHDVEGFTIDDLLDIEERNGR